MESANFYHHHRQQQDHHQLINVDSSFPPWSSNPISNGTRNNNINSRNLDSTCTIDSMVQDLGFRYNNSQLETLYVTHELQRLARIKDEFSSVAEDHESYPLKFLELLNCSPTSSIQDLHLQMSRSYSNTNNQDFQNTIINDIGNSNGTFSQIFPTTTSILSTLNQPTATASSLSSSSSSSSSAISSSPFDMNCLPGLDLYGSPRFDGHFRHHSSLNAYNLGGQSSYGFDQRMHQSNHRPAVCPSKISSPAVSNTASTNQSTNKRTANKYIDTKSTQTVPLKKPKSEPRSSAAAPFQVRKEKLGDRIAAIQQLVSPFGKTDTASVLMEAIGYIKFLQTQIETLSVPYMKKSTNKTGGLSQEWGQIAEDGNTDAAGKRDLRSRGLCLVPVSCLSYVTHGSCEDFWPAP